MLLKESFEGAGVLILVYWILECLLCLYVSVSRKYRVGFYLALWRQTHFLGTNLILFLAVTLSSFYLWPLALLRTKCLCEEKAILILKILHIIWSCICILMFFAAATELRNAPRISNSDAHTNVQMLGEISVVKPSDDWSYTENCNGEDEARIKSWKPLCTVSPTQTSDKWSDSSHGPGEVLTQTEMKL